MVRKYSAVAVCTPGLEAICSAELSDLGLRPKPAGPGAVEFMANARQLYAANVWLRSAARVLIEVAKFRATDFPHLVRGASQVDWAQWVPPGHGVAFRVSSSDSKLYHTEAVAERLHSLVGPPAASHDQPEQLIVVRIVRNTVTLRVDASGVALYKRPWRTELGPAPLRATMAASMLTLAGFEGRRPVIDPFCGSGTIPIEAALLARGLPPGGPRKYAFQRWPSFEPGSWASVQGSCAGAARSSCEASIVAHDRDSSRVEAAIRNAERAGVAEDIDFSTKVVSHLSPISGRGIVVTNPPYGKRIGHGELTGLYRRFGTVVRERLPSCDVMVVCPDSRLAKAADRELRTVAQFQHGGLRVSIRHKRGQEANGDG